MLFPIGVWVEKNIKRSDKSLPDIHPSCLGRQTANFASAKPLTAIHQRLCVICWYLQSCKLKFLAWSYMRTIYQIHKACDRAIAHHSTYSALGASTFHSLRTRFAHQLIAGAKQYWAYPNYYYPGLQTDT